MRVLVKTSISPYSGYGNDGIALVRALLNWGVEVYLQPTSIQSPVPIDVLMPLTKHLEAPFDLSIVHQDPGVIETSRAMKEASTLTIAWTMWEFKELFLPEIPQSTVSARLNQFDIIVAYDEVTQGALEAHTETPFTTVQGGYEVSEWQFVNRDWHSETFNFFMQGILHERKGPWYGIEAFKELKEEYPEEFANVHLHMKTTSGEGLHPRIEEWVPNLHLHYGIWPLQKLQEFYSQMHVLLAPSIGEGKNLPALQFLSTGGAVIATNWGGHASWMNSAYAYPLNYGMQVFNNLSECAKPDKAHLKELMLHVFRNRNEAARKGSLAARTIPLMCSWESVLERLFDRLEVAHPKGKTVKEAAIMCRKSRDTEHLEKRSILMGTV